MMSEVKLRSPIYTDLDIPLHWQKQEDIVQLYSVHPFPVEEPYLNNIEALNLFERVEFIEDNVLRKEVFKNNHFHVEWIFGFSNEEFSG